MMSYETFLEEPSVIDLISSGNIERIVQELGKAELGENFDYLIIPMLCYILKEKGIKFNLGGQVKRIAVDAKIILLLSSSGGKFKERSFDFLMDFDEYFENRDSFGSTAFGLLELATRDKRLEHTFISPFINSNGKWKLGAIGIEVQED